MARLRIDDWSVTVSLSVAEKIQALLGNVTVPRTAVIGARAVPDGMAEVHGIRTGTGLPGVILVGTARDGDSVTFAVCHGRAPAVVLDLAGQPYDRIVVTVANPGEIVSGLPEPDRPLRWAGPYTERAAGYRWPGHAQPVPRSCPRQ